MSVYRFDPPPSSPAHRQRGSIVVPAAFTLLVGILLLGSAQIGWQFYMKREMQNAADMAALSAVQVMSDRPTTALCEQARLAARDSARAQMPGMSDTLTDAEIRVDCVRWDAASMPTRPDGVVPGTAVTLANAVRVDIAKSYTGLIPNLLPGDNQTPVAAKAIATLAPESAAFSVGAQLLSTNPNTPLMSVLSFVGLPANVTVLDYNGVVNAKVTPGGLLKELVPNIDLNTVTPTQLAGVSATASQILQASVNVLRKADPQAVTANVGILANALAANANLGHVRVPLFGPQSSPGLFGVITTAGRDAALAAEVSALNLIQASIESATAAYGLAVKTLDLGLLRVQAGIVEPPSIGAGGVGATAYNAQVRVFIDLDTDRLKLVAPVLNLLGARIRLPLTIDLARAQGTITDIDCHATPRTVDILVRSSTLQACFADPGQANRFSRGQACGDEIRNNRRPGTVTISLLGVDLLPQRLRPLEVLGWQKTVRFNVPPNANFPLVDAGEVNPARVGNMLSDWLLTLSDGLAHPSLSNNATQDNQYTAVAERYLEATKRGGKYDVAAAVRVLRNGDTALGFAPVGDWTIEKATARPCLLLGTCWEPGSVWRGFETSVTGQGLGLLQTLTGALLGNLLVNNCASVLGALDYNGCVKRNLASYLRSNPNDLPLSSEFYCGPVCTLLKPVLDLLAPTLNGLGKLVVSDILANGLGLEIGKTETKLLDLQCRRAKLVY